MNTNARQHVERYGKGEWRVAEKVAKCDRYFGTVRGCPGIVRPAERFFDTQERPDGARPGTPSYKCCIVCGHALARSFPTKAAA